MKNQSITQANITQTNITLTDVENYISARFPEHAQPGQRYATVVTTKQVVDFLAAREEVRRVKNAEIQLEPKVRAERDTANSNKETAHTAWCQAKERVSEMEMRNALHRFFTRGEIAETMRACEDAKAKFEAAKVASDKAHAAYAEAYQRLVYERDLEVAEMGKEVAMMRQAITKAIADAMAVPAAESPAATTDSVEAIHGIVRDEFVNREVFKEAVIAIILQQLATGKKDVLVSEDVLEEVRAAQDHERDLNAKGFGSPAGVARFVAAEVAKRIGLTFLTVSYKMAGNSENSGPAYIMVK